MKIDVSMVMKKLTGNSALVTYLATAVVGFLSWLFIMVQTDANLKAENKFRYANDSLRVRIMELHIDCSR